MAQCADRAQAMNLKDSRSLAEFGRAYLLAGLPNKAEAAFVAAIRSQGRGNPPPHRRGLAVGRPAGEGLRRYHDHANR